MSIINYPLVDNNQIHFWFQSSLSSEREGCRRERERARPCLFLWFGASKRPFYFLSSGRINMRLTEGYNGLYKINTKTTWLMAKPTLKTKSLYSGLVTPKYSFSKAALHKEPLKFTSVVLHLKAIELSSFCNFNQVITDATGTQVELWLPWEPEWNASCHPLLLHQGIKRREGKKRRESHKFNSVGNQTQWEGGSNKWLCQWENGNLRQISRLAKAVVPWELICKKYDLDEVTCSTAHDSSFLPQTFTNLSINVNYCYSI